ncbi:MAG: FtsX-like permease family protein [Bacteroidota bacterium]
MNLPFNIAKRYIFSKKSTNAINVISGISVFGIAIGTAVMILLFSVFNGLEDLLTGFFNTYNPDIKVVPISAKNFSQDSVDIVALENIEGVEFISKTLEEVAFFEYDSDQTFGIIKGVDDNFSKVNQIDTIIREGAYRLKIDDKNTVVVGAGIRRKLSLNVDDFLTPLIVYSAKRKKVGPTSQPFKKVSIFAAGVFAAYQEDLDNRYVFASLDFVEELLSLKGKLSALEIRLNPAANQSETIAAIKDVIGDQFEIKDRYQQEETYFKVLKMEKWLGFALVGFALILVAFNMVGALWVIVLDKKKDIAILKSMGAEDQQIRNIFLSNGLMLSAFGLIMGMILSVTLYGIHQTWGIVTMPPGAVIDIYPASMRFPDFIVVAVTVMFIGLVASWGPALRASKIPTIFQEG